MINQYICLDLRSLRISLRFHVLRVSYQQLFWQNVCENRNFLNFFAKKTGSLLTVPVHSFKINKMSIFGVPDEFAFKCKDLFILIQIAAIWFWIIYPLRLFTFEIQIRWLHFEKCTEQALRSVLNFILLVVYKLFWACKE